MCQYYSSDIEFILHNNHGMEDDLGIEFTKYDFCLSLYKLNRGKSIQGYDDLYNKMAQDYTQKISTELNTKCLLVADSQHILMKLEKSEN